GFKSVNFIVPVHGSSKLSNFKAFLDYPNYTGREDEYVTNPVNLSLPEGTKVRFSGQLQNVNTGTFLFADTNIKIEQGFNFSVAFYHPQVYTISLKNTFDNSETIFQKQVDVIKDEYPFIDVKEVVDTS